jgi:hypothetical protein
VKKKSFSIGLIILLCCLFFSLGFEISYSDSGWDTGYDYGGGFDYDYGGGYDYDYDYGYDSDYDYDSSSNGSSANPKAVLIFIIFFFLFFVLIDIISKNSSNKTKKYNERPTRTDNPELFVDNVESINMYLPKITLSKLKDELYQDFVNIQKAWMDFDYNKLRELCTDELFNSYKTQLKVLKAKNEQNIMSDFELNHISITDVKEQNGQIILEVFMVVSFFDYVINTTTNKVTRGNKHKLITNNYLMTFVKSKEKVDTSKCPNCGAPLNKNHSTVCDYCNSNMVFHSNKFILSKKSNLKQF